MLKFKDRFLRGQGANTRARNCLKNVDAKVSASAAKYRSAYTALRILGPLLGQVGWQSKLRNLGDDDIRSMSDGGEEGEGRRRLSWIWLLCECETNADNEPTSSAIRIEWCKARARAHRWAEEVELLFEEKRRTLKYLRWAGNWWYEKAVNMTTTDTTLAEGLRAYAGRQAALRRELAQSFEHTWRDTQRLLDIADGAETSPPSPSP
ncbi:hypothetical protein PAXINDRAFT_94870 [Paxillus involutus ATCC 200175]|uniref:Uncharacterized protein n=1 Tax=Paxillus involutus ATCC 200175 TaxID=664439 RepID=A0A0C9SLE5_PAXIN|nr:hypothetical protein PAXINDRAFT_94870 [Paxillus involutus ATCC 200175]